MWNRQISPQGSLIVISGPSGSGKTSVVEALCQSDPRLTRSVSATTRLPRPTEIDGVNYHFLPSSKFKTLIHEDGFVEWTKYGGNHYGTLKAEIEPPLAHGRDLILEIDVDGAMQLKSRNLKSVFIFILPPSFAILERRLRSRQTESDHELQHRLEIARSEIAKVKDYDYCVFNLENGIEEAVQQIHYIIFAQRRRIDNQLLGSISQEFSQPSSNQIDYR